MKLEKNFLQRILTAAVFCLPGLVQAASIDATQLNLFYAIPFCLILLGIATLPLFANSFWHHHYGKYAIFCGLLAVVPLVMTYGFGATSGVLAFIAFDEYVPFIVLLTALFVVSGGIFFPIPIEGTPYNNTLILFVGAVLASLMGTTGAAMLLIRPLVRANAGRNFKTHTFVFFIFIVANIGGSLTPLGDPPLFLGFLKGVSFFWLVQHLWLHVLVTILFLLTMYYLLDCFFYKKESSLAKQNIHMDAIQLATANVPNKLVIGQINFIFLLATCGLVLLSGAWDSGVEWSMFGVHFKLQSVLRDIGLLLVILLSLKYTPVKARIGNEFNWEPIKEVAKLFAAIFVTIAPVMSMLALGHDGQFSAVLALTEDGQGRPITLMYFWVTGILSGFLDNAPTYLVAFNMAGGDATRLMGELSSTLVAISLGSVFMGALSYIGNAPNMMVKAVVESRGSKMPSFIGYVLWSTAILIPTFILLSIMFFMS